MTKIEHFTSQSPNFYEHIGQFAMNAEVIKEFHGYPLITRNDWHWFIAFEDGLVAGFCAYWQRYGIVVLESAYVVPNFRRQGIYSKLFGVRMEHIRSSPNPPTKLICVATKLSTPHLLKSGFIITKKFVKWNKMELLWKG